MELRQLKYFRVIAEVKSFNRASAVLFVSQPALSRQIKLLEDELETKLFFRDGRGAQLTPAGVEFYTHVRGIEKRLNEAREATEKYSGKSSEIAIGVPPSLGTRFMTNITLAIKNLFPQISLILIEDFSHQLIDWVHSGRLDIAIVYGKPKSSAARCVPFASTNLYLLKSASSSDETTEKISFADLVNYKLLSPAVPSTTRSKLEDIAESLDAKLEFELQIDSQSTLIRLVSDGDYHCVLPYSAVAEEVARGEICAIEIVDPCPLLELSVMTAANARPSRTLELIEGILRRQLTDMIETRFWTGVAEDFPHPSGKV